MKLKGTHSIQKGFLRFCVVNPLSIHTDNIPLSPTAHPKRQRQPIFLNRISDYGFHSLQDEDHFRLIV